jgi:hypothetical protein
MNLSPFRWLRRRTNSDGRRRADHAAMALAVLFIM